ncbi:hypothetical protein AB0D15_16510, partial [Streptomyces sp. NPDC048551]
MNGTRRADGTTDPVGDGAGGWEELVATALLGTERRGGAPEALLGAAAEALHHHAISTPWTTGEVFGETEPALHPI